MKPHDEAATYRRAAALIRRNGWFQKEAEAPRLCLSMALIKVASFPLYLSKAQKYLPALYEVIGPSMLLFNDAPGMTREDVLAALEIAEHIALCSKSRK